MHASKLRMKAGRTPVSNRSARPQILPAPIRAQAMMMNGDRRYADILTSLMVGDSSVVHARYDRPAQAAYPLHQTAHGYADITAFWADGAGQLSVCRLHHPSPDRPR